MELTTRDVAGRLGVNQSRVRALVSSGALDAQRAGSQWLVNADSVDRQAEFIAAHATGRAMAPRVAWAAGDLADGGQVTWLSASERSRLRKRLRTAATSEVFQRWLLSRASQVMKYRIGEHDLESLLSQDGVIRTGISATAAYNLGLGTGNDGDAYVSQDLAGELVRDFFLIESTTGNLTLRVVDHDLHLRTARDRNGQQVSTRLIVGVDLADGRDTRTKSTGRSLLRTIQAEQGRR